MPDFALDLEKTATLIRRERPSVVFLCSPNNPTGLADSNESVAAVLEQTSAVGGLLVVDEAYAEFAPETALDLLHEGSPLVVTRTYSKTWAMAAARLGYLAGPSQLVADLEKAALPYRLNSVTQAVGEIALRFQEEMAIRVASIKSERARICAGLDDLGVRYWHSDANFILFRGDFAKSITARIVGIFGRRHRPQSGKHSRRRPALAQAGRPLGAGARLLFLARSVWLLARNSRNPRGELSLSVSTLSNTLSNTARNIERHF